MTKRARNFCWVSPRLSLFRHPLLSGFSKKKIMIFNNYKIGTIIIKKFLLNYYLIDYLFFLPLNSLINLLFRHFLLFSWLLNELSNRIKCQKMINSRWEFRSIASADGYYFLRRQDPLQKDEKLQKKKKRK